MYRRLADKFFLNQTTPEQTRKVLEWFEIPEGKRYLMQKLAADETLMQRKDLREYVGDLDSEKLYQSITQNVQLQKTGVRVHRRPRKPAYWAGYAIKAAAVLLVAACSIIFTMQYEKFQAGQITEPEPVVFTTGDEQHREITLGDGTVIRLNDNSELIVSADFMGDKREVSLAGEAYFDVARNPDKPFIIHANQSSVEVLGTAFNVRSLPGDDNVQVAVVDGRVAFQSVGADSQHEVLSVTLSRGQYGYMDLEKRTIQLDELAVENYLAWKEGRFVFDGLTLSQVCTQLSRIYEVECGFSEGSLRELKLTSSFTNESLEKTLEVIALSLDLQYEKNAGQVFWH